ncbi:MAG: hypothetical protein ABL995_21010 [Bryobacteraceae bacterium]
MKRQIIVTGVSGLWVAKAAGFTPNTPCGQPGFKFWMTAGHGSILPEAMFV